MDTRQNSPRFVVVPGPHDGMPALKLCNPTKEERDFVAAAVTCQHMDDPRYKLHVEAGAFLQCDDPEFVLVEFWKESYAPFVQWLNDNFDEFVAFWKEQE